MQQHRDDIERWAEAAAAEAVVGSLVLFRECCATCLETPSNGANLAR